MERTFDNYRRLHDICNVSRNHNNSIDRTHKKLSPNKLIQRYGNSYIIRFNQGKYSFIIGPHWIGVLTTIIIIFGGCYVNINLLDNNTNWSLHMKNYFKLFIYIFRILATFLLLCTATTEPGIVFSNNEAVSKGLEEGSELNVHDTTYCEICSVYQWRVKKIYHCDSCNYCIEEMDHHCPWMGQCIGKKNVFWFVLFNFTWVILFSEYVYVAYFTF